MSKAYLVASARNATKQNLWQVLHGPPLQRGCRVGPTCQREGPGASKHPKRAGGRVLAVRPTAPERGRSARRHRRLARAARDSRNSSGERDRERRQGPRRKEARCVRGVRSARMGAGDGDAAASKEKGGSGGGHERTSLDGVRDKNVMQLKKLNTALFPVRYNDKYYQDAIASKDFSKLGAPFHPSHPLPSPSRPHFVPRSMIPSMIVSLESSDLRLESQNMGIRGLI